MVKWLKHSTVDQRVPGWNPTCCCLQVKHFLHPSSPWEISLWLKGPEVKINKSTTPFPRPFQYLGQSYMKGWSFKIVLLLSCVCTCSILSADVRKWRVSIALVSWHTFLFHHPCSQPVSITIIFWLYTLQHGNGASVYTLFPFHLILQTVLPFCLTLTQNFGWSGTCTDFHPKGHSVVPNLHQVHVLFASHLITGLTIASVWELENTLLCQRIQAYH